MFNIAFFCPVEGFSHIEVVHQSFCSLARAGGRGFSVQFFQVFSEGLKPLGFHHFHCMVHLHNFCDHGHSRKDCRVTSYPYLSLKLFLKEQEVFFRDILPSAHRKTHISDNCKPVIKNLFQITPNFCHLWRKIDLEPFDFLFLDIRLNVPVFFRFYCHVLDMQGFADL
ncbi:hypothetical protein SDC9_168615 [bioreactor metagenome]|uniref:Uncharacterized protein n=1 Tax=bioreactor metagenome TaxID=1076179 RepID=A0A645G526_9ZZZZ